MLRKLFIMLTACIALTSCNLIKDPAALQEKVMESAKEAVVKIVNKKIDAREDISESTKEFLKEVAKNFIDNTFDRLKSEYEKLTQEEIEKDLETLTVKNIDSVCGSYLKASQQKK